jgi:hypothetical protein
MGKIIRLTESDLIKIVNRVISEQKTLRQSKPRKVMDRTENELVHEIYRLLVDSYGFKQDFNNVSEAYVLGKNEFKKYSASWYTQEVSGPLRFRKGDMVIYLDKRFADIIINRYSYPGEMDRVILDSTDPNTIKKIEKIIKNK